MGRRKIPFSAQVFVHREAGTVRSATLGGESQKQRSLRCECRVAILFPANRRSAGVDYAMSCAWNFSSPS
ncbi:hypothetical protein ACQKK5_17360 [Brevibacillus panacihumi]|uniref:hypothetical protein n=1 Tax=Brevibacillus panacihumi TaxID=497735 RepID=UPI003D01B882